MEKLKLIPQTKFENKVKEPVMVQYLDTEYIEKTLRNLIRSIENLEDKKLKYKGENILPIYAGSGTETSDYAGLPGKIFAKIIESNPLSNYCERIPNKQGIIGKDFANLKDKELFAFWSPHHIVSDTRIAPLQTDTSLYFFELHPFQREINVNIRLIYRKVFKPLAKVKLWECKDLMIHDIQKQVNLKKKSKTERTLHKIAGSDCQQ